MSDWVSNWSSKRDGDSGEGRDGVIHPEAEDENHYGEANEISCGNQTEKKSSRDSPS